jgi:hypothetical protein
VAVAMAMAMMLVLLVMRATTAAQSMARVKP